MHFVNATDSTESCKLVRCMHMASGWTRFMPCSAAQAETLDTAIAPMHTYVTE